MSGSTGLPEGWDPDKDSLEALVRSLFADDVDTARPAPSTGTGSGSRQRQRPGPPTVPPRRLAPPISATRRPPRSITPVTSRPATDPGPARTGRARLAASSLAGAILVAVSVAGWLLYGDAQPQGGEETVPAAVVAPPVEPLDVPEPLDVRQPVAAPAAVPPVPVDPVIIDFGGRADIGDGWRIAVTRPYPCTVLMAVPALQQDGTRIVRVTVTLVNTTGSGQRTGAWSLGASAGGAPAELVLWPAAGFRGVPDVLLAPGRSVRFPVAVRISEQRTRLDVSADRAAATRAVLGGTL